MLIVIYRRQPACWLRPETEPESIETTPHPITVQMGVSTLPHVKMMHAIELLGDRVAPMVREEIPVIAK
jgi:hypothetical protein